MENWRNIWREGIAPQLDEQQLRALQSALQSDSAELCQGATVRPNSGWRKERSELKPVQCCPIAYTGWKSCCETVEEVGLFFVDVWQGVERRAGVRSGHVSADIRYFTNWWDDNRREVVVPALLQEVTEELKRRSHVSAITEEE